MSADFVVISTDGRNAGSFIQTEFHYPSFIYSSMNKYKFCVLGILCLFGSLSCDVLKDVRKQKPVPKLSITTPEIEVDSSKVSNFITAQIDSSSAIVVTRGEITEDNEYMALIELDEVEVVTKMKNIAERFGEIEMTFDILLPASLLNSAWAVTMTPKLSSGNISKDLLPVVFKGSKFADKQDAQYEKYNKYRSKLIFEEDSFHISYINVRLYNIYLTRCDYLAEKSNKIQKIKHDLNTRKAAAITSRYEGKKIDLSPALISDLDRLSISNSERKVVTVADTARAKDLFFRSKYYTKNKKKVASVSETFDRMVQYKKIDPVYKDSVVDGKKVIKLTYKHIEPSDESASRYYLSLAGEASVYNGKNYDFAALDTLTFMVSSLSMFADTATRYKTKVIERRVDLVHEAHIEFKKGSAVVIDTLAENPSELEKLKHLLYEIDLGSEFEVDSILLNSGASPDGEYSLNQRLSVMRASSIISYLKSDERLDLDFSELFRIKESGENWKDLYAFLRNDTLISQIKKADVLNKLEREKQPDRREALLKKELGPDFAQFEQMYYKQLRRVRFEFVMHRKGMVKDTIHTTVVDDTYAYGVQLIQNKQYKQALEVLSGYEDYNVALLYLCLGYNERAFDMLTRIKETSANKEYLLAVLCARSGRHKQALSHYLRSVELDPVKAFRGNLDPEISRIKKMFELE